MAYTLQQLSDFEDIRTLKHRYFRGIDTADWELVRGLFTEHVSIDYRGGGYRVTLTGRADLMEFLANSFTTDSVAMHHGHMPEIRLTGEHTAEGTWYLEDIFISLAGRSYTSGTALYHDRYVREPDGWKIARSEYDRVMELNQPLPPGLVVSSQLLARTARPFAQRADISRLITWTSPAA